MQIYRYVCWTMDTKLLIHCLHGSCIICRNCLYLYWEPHYTWICDNPRQFQVNNIYLYNDSSLRQGLAMPFIMEGCLLRKNLLLSRIFFKKCRQLQGPPYTGVNDRNIVCTLMFVCNIMYIYIISVFNFVIKHALFRHDNHRFDSNSRLLPVQYFARRSKSDNSIVFIFFYFPRAIT